MSVIPYLGEKSKFSNFIIPNIPLNISTYVEPFGGMYGIFFSLELDKFPDTNFVYNDINKLNYNLFNQLKNPLFLDKLINFEATADKYYKIKSELINNRWSEEESAINWLLILCCSKSQYDISNGDWKNNGEFEIFKLKLKHIEEYLDKIQFISNQDYKSVVNKWDSESSFFYLDPPYKGREHYYINHDFSDESHEELSHVIKNIKGRFALSYYYFPEIDEWYKDHRILRNRTLMGTELLIMNY